MSAHEATTTPFAELVDTTREVLYLGHLSMKFARVERVPTYHDGRHETDVEHSYMLGLVAPHLASRYYPDLDVGLVSQFSMVHDLPEVIVGDTPSLGISEEMRDAKEAAEAAAAKRLIAELPSGWGEILSRYEAQTEPEARFVRMVDKLMPLIVNVYGNRVQLERYGITTPEQLAAAEYEESRRLQVLFPEFAKIHKLRLQLIEVRARAIFPD